MVFHLRMECLPSSARGMVWGLFGMKRQERELIQLCVLPSSFYLNRETVSFYHSLKVLNTERRKINRHRWLRESHLPRLPASSSSSSSPRLADGITSWPVSLVNLLWGVVLLPISFKTEKVGNDWLHALWLEHQFLRTRQKLGIQPSLLYLRLDGLSAWRQEDGLI